MNYVFESIRIENSIIEDFEIHLNRLLKSAFYKFGISYDIKDLFTNSLDFLKNELYEKNRVYKFNIILYKDNTIEFKLAPYIINKSKNLIVLNDKIRKYGDIYYKDSDYRKIFDKYNDIFNSFIVDNSQIDNFQDLILLNDKNNISECLTSNIFFAKNNVLYTPSIKQGLFNGITRQKIINIVDYQKIKLKITSIPVNTIGYFDSCFILNSLKRIVNINKIVFNNLNFTYLDYSNIKNINILLSKNINRTAIF
ncbi:MAG: aminotransferase class IV [Candidatus Muirbacterium halophilum]|nr:aminotransferase class IV [Candidatus Muirbacterium halophilum]